MGEDTSAGLGSRGSHAEIPLVQVRGEQNSEWQSWASSLGGRKAGLKFCQPEEGMKPWCQPSWERVLGLCPVLPPSLLFFACRDSGGTLQTAPLSETAEHEAEGGARSISADRGLETVAEQFALKCSTSALPNAVKFNLSVFGTRSFCATPPLTR